MDAAHETATDMAAAASRPSEERPVLLLEELKEKRAELKRSPKLISPTLKSESKKQKRLIQKAGRLSKDDLMFLVARQQRQQEP